MVFERLRGYLEQREPDSAALSAYGKLPQYGDFIRHRLSSRGALAFKGWLDRGISRFWEGDPEYSRHRIETHAVLLSFPPAGARVFGCLWGSHDAAGLRSFPFAVFLTRPMARRPGITLPGLELLGEVTRRAGELRPRLEAASELEEIASALGPVRIELAGVPEAESKRELEQCLAEVRLGELAASFYGAEWQRPWTDLMRYLRRRAAGDAPLAVRLPSSDRLPLVCQVGFWALFLQPILGRAGTAVQLLYPLDRDDRGIILLRRELRHEDVHVFHPEMPGDELIEDLRQEVPAGRRGQDDAAPADGSATLASVLARGLGGA